jgi:hypothetical protein
MPYVSIGRAGWWLAVVLLVRGEHLSLLILTVIRLLIVLCAWHMSLLHGLLNETPTHLQRSRGKHRSFCQYGLQVAPVLHDALSI